MTFSACPSTRLSSAFDCSAEGCPKVEARGDLCLGRFDGGAVVGVQEAGRIEMKYSSLERVSSRGCGRVDAAASARSVVILLIDAAAAPTWAESDVSELSS